MSLPVKIPGLRVVLAGREFVVPPLSLGQVEQLRERISAVQAAPDAQSISTILDAATAALQRNYPELKREEVAELIDVGNMMEVFGAVMDVSGLKRKAQEAEIAGGVMPPAPASTGGSSTQT